MDNRIIEAADDIFRPVFESSVVMAANYSKACDRNGITVQDMAYAFRFCARNITGRHSGSLYPEVYEEDSTGSESDDEYVVDDSEIEEFRRYSGTEEIFVQVNECYDTWDSWVPQNDAERLIKNSIDSYGISGNPQA
tara:strand:- start:280 stop:690 length:411 start_codon:yes stop_codon:yes gene_type:complete